MFFFQSFERSARLRSGPSPTIVRSIGKDIFCQSSRGCVRSDLDTPCGRSTFQRWRPSSSLARPRASKFRTSGRRRRRGISSGSRYVSGNLMVCPRLDLDRSGCQFRLQKAGKYGERRRPPSLSSTGSY